MAVKNEEESFKCPDKNAPILLSSSSSEISRSSESDSGDDSEDSEWNKAESDEEEEFNWKETDSKKQKTAGYKTPTASVEDQRQSQSETATTLPSRVKVEMARKRRRNNSPRRRQVGRRIYDSILGQTCHWCRQKTVESHVQCYLCPIRFCGQCLLNRNGEVVAEELSDGVLWTCPKCRGGCGLGCENCCNCGPCRNKQGLGPTGQLIDKARRAGFKNVHDYLVHLKTGEDAEAISKRKLNRGWTKATGALVRSSKVDEDAIQKGGSFDKTTNYDAEDEPEQDTEYQDAAEKSSGEAESYEFQGTASCDGITTKTGSPKDGDVQMDNNETEGPTARLRHHRRKDCKPAVTSLDDLNFIEDEHAAYTGPYDYAKKLEVMVQKPFSSVRLKQMVQRVTSRTPIKRIRQTRSRTIEVDCTEKGRSYLDRFPELGDTLANATSPQEKWIILRGFFFWLTHTFMDGAFQPWLKSSNTDDCSQIPRPYHQTVQVLVDEDDGNEDAPRDIFDPAKVKKEKL